MDYTLAKKLKDAGFPQMADDSRDLVFPSYKEEERFTNSIGEDWQYAYVPTLEEMIEACGDRFWSLVQQGTSQWTSESNDGKDYINAPTPIEAVANLYIALNEK